MTDFFAWFDAEVAVADPRVKAAMDAAAYLPHHTGGGCMAWSRRLDDGNMLIVCFEDGYLSGDPAEPRWHVSRDDEECGFTAVDEGLTLADALELATKLPSPEPLGNQTTFARARVEAGDLAQEPV